MSSSIIFPKFKQILIDQACGDVAANGEVGLLSKPDQFNELESYQSGISMEKLRKTFFGDINGQLFFADVVSNMNNYFDSYVVTDVYTLDPSTRNKTYVA